MTSQRIHTVLTPFDVADTQWFPAAAGLAVTVIVHPVAEWVSPHKKVRRVEFINLVSKSGAGKILRTN